MLTTPSLICLDRRQSADGSIKYLWQLEQGTVESIFFTFQGQPYICVSSQMGCNVGCPFCATGRQRNRYNLTATEITAQVQLAMQDLSECGGPARIFQVAFAGMGEPLLNFRHVTTAAAALLESGITETVSLSTSGIVPMMEKLAGTAITKLFISLHATTDELRTQLVPANKKYPLASVLSAARAFYARVGVKVTATYLLLRDLNDSDADLARLCTLLDPAIFIVQLSVWNPIAGLSFVPSKRLEQFRTALAGAGFEVFILQSRGTDIEGGCGQLRSRPLPMRERRR